MFGYIDIKLRALFKTKVMNISSYIHSIVPQQCKKIAKSRGKQKEIER